MVAAVLIFKLSLFCSKNRDPRFENLSGKFSTDQFRKQYAFVYDEALPEERNNLKRQLQVMMIENHVMTCIPIVDMVARHAVA